MLLNQRWEDTGRILIVNCMATSTTQTDSGLSYFFMNTILTCFCHFYILQICSICRYLLSVFEICPALWQ
jgi:hypothetical protein